MKLITTIAIIMIMLMIIPIEIGQATIINTEFDKLKIKILNCESNLKHKNIWGDNHRSYGIAQFQLRTFNYLKNRANRKELKWKSIDDQLWLFDWSLKNGYAKNWTCYRKCKF